MSCARSEKTRYRKRKFAATVAAWQRKISGEDITPYHCDKCHCWHTGHTPTDGRT